MVLMKAGGYDDSKKKISRGLGGVTSLGVWCFAEKEDPTLGKRRDRTCDDSAAGFRSVKT